MCAQARIACTNMRVPFFCTGYTVNAEIPLAKVGGNVSITYNAKLSSIKLPHLASIGGQLQVESNAIMPAFEAPRLAKIGIYVRFHCDRKLTVVDFSAMKAGAIRAVQR